MAIRVAFTKTPPPAPPEWLNGKALEKWHELAPKLTWSPGELANLAAYCAQFARWWAAEQHLAKSPDNWVVTITNDRGEVKSHGPAPDIKIAEMASKEMQRLGKALRLARIK